MSFLVGSAGFGMPNKLRSDLTLSGEIPVQSELQKHILLRFCTHSLLRNSISKKQNHQQGVSRETCRWNGMWVRLCYTEFISAVKRCNDHCEL